MVLTVVNADVRNFSDYFISLLEDSQTQWKGHVEKLFRNNLIVPVYVDVQLKDCPSGFELVQKRCDCAGELKEYVFNCSIDTMKIQSKPFVWLGVKNNLRDPSEDNSTYLTHNHCPFDYCKTGSQEFSLENPDAQCNQNRSGVLCGECVDGSSLTLGTTECRECTNNIYLLLLLPFALAGILLVLFLLLTDMTVAAGTINGLLFFTNIVKVNQSIFFPQLSTRSFLSVFIAWLNLDLGISTCFYDGLDAYVFTWLQLAFPAYIWLLVFSIIIASRYFGFMNKLCGQNVVPVLATLFLLSYTKLQRTITTILTPTVVNVKLWVWLRDGNVSFLQGKHIPLFVFGLFLYVLLVLYTLSLLFGPWLQTKNQYRGLRWVSKLKPFFDAYYGPLKDKYRCWTGVLLLSRFAISLVCAVNVLGDDTINLLAVVILTLVLLLGLLWQSGGVYKIWVLTALDSFFLLNLGTLAAVTFFNKFPGSSKSQFIAISISMGSAFAIFCLIFLYHCLKRLAKYKFVKVMLRSRSRSLLMRRNTDNEVLNAIDANRKYDSMVQFISS